MARASMRRDDEAGEAALAQLMANGSRSFHAASLFLPRRVRAPAQALYAFCRLADDAVDDGADSFAAVADLERRLDAIYAGRPADHPVDRAFAATVERHELPRDLPAALIEGFAWDAQGRTYATLPDLHAYCTRVAGTVGIMMALVMGRRDAESLARASDLGIAMQLTNIARDVGEDAARGRVYLPLDWLADADCDPRRPRAGGDGEARLFGLVRRILEDADRHYARAEAGVARLPADCRVGIQAARLIYAEIGREIERRGPAALSRRAIVPGRRKAALVARAALQAHLLDPGPHGAAPQSAAHLVLAASAPSPQVSAAGGVIGRVAWLIDLFERLERKSMVGPVRS